MAALTKVLTASNTPRLSEKDEKVAAELAGSQSRVEAVSKDPKALAALACLAQLMESKQTADDKLSQYSQVAAEFIPVATLLKSSHVKEPRGEFLYGMMHDLLMQACIQFTGARKVRAALIVQAKWARFKLNKRMKGNI